MTRPAPKVPARPAPAHRVPARPAPAPGGPAAAPLLRRIATDPAGPLLATVVGPGGAGKTAVLDALAAGYRQAGIEVARHVPRTLPAVLDPDRPVLIDDAHRLDGRHLDTIHGLVESGTARLVLAHRPWPRPSALRAATAGGPARRLTVVVSHLDRAAVASRLAGRLGVTPPDGLVELVHEQSGGLPTLVDLLTQALCDAGRFDPARPTEFRRPDGVAVSMGMAERMRHHVDALEPPVQELLAALAVGAPLDLDVLRELLDLDPASAATVLADAVEAAKATGLVTEAGVLIPIVGSLMLRLTPMLRTRDLQRRLAVLELDRGGSMLTAGRRLLGTGVSGQRVATVFTAAAAEARTESPLLAAELYTAAVDAGAAPRSVAGARSHASALAGDLDRALQLADQVIAEPDAPDRAEALFAAAAVLAHRGLLASGAELLRMLPPAPATLAVPALLGTGALDEARATLEAGLRDTPNTVVARAATLLAGGMLSAVTGSGPAALSQLARAAVLLEPVAPSTLLPDTPAALTALVAMEGGDHTVAELALRRAVGGRHGGRPAMVRHRLLLAWLGLTRGRPEAARQLLAAADRRLEPREELLAAALAIGLARRDNDSAALAAACARARTALVEHPVDLYSLPWLGEAAVAAARRGAADWVGPHLEEAEALLARLGRPPLWTATLHWYRLQAAVAVEDGAEVGVQAAALAELAAVGPRHAALAAAATAWASLFDGTLDAERVQDAARGLHAAGLVWDAAVLAGQAGQRATERRDVLALQACARALAGPAADPVTGPAPAAGDHPRAVDDAPAGAPDPAAEPADPPAASVLSEREQEIGSLVLAGLTYKQIGEQLFISAKTVEHHVARMRDRLGVTSRNDLFGRLRALV